MGPPAPGRFTFGQLSIGLQILLILILVGSCSGASDNAVINSGVDDGDVQRLHVEVTELSSEVRKLRRELRQQR